MTSAMAEPAAMKWWGWGDPERRIDIPAERLAGLRQLLGASERRADPVPFELVRVDEPRLEGRIKDRLVELLGSEWVRDDRLSRVLHAGGKGYPDLVRARAGSAEAAPDVVAYPAGEAHVRAILDLSGEEGIAVVPFGGGTSVVGGVEPVRGPFDGLISLDLARMTDVDVDERSLTATLGPGLRGPALEAALSSSGLTLGHFPQSFERATLGGWVATRSAGQASTGFGKIEDMVVGIRCMAPAGEISLPPLPASAAGPQLRELLVGSEGVLGVITSATLEVRPVPEQRRYEGWMFRGFAEGADAFRRLEQAGAAPDVARLSDEVETRVTLELGGGSATGSRVGRAYVGARGYGEGCLAIVGFEGDRSAVVGRRARAARALRSNGGLYLGTAPGKAWERGRYEGPYLRDALLDHCIMVETLETAAEWSGVMDLYAAVREAIAAALGERGTPPLVMCHMSHLYPSGASLYFTFFAAQEEGAELEQWQVAKTAATDAITTTGGTLTHHHAIGRDHAAWLPRELGPLGVSTLRAVKKRLDPEGIMNPGKLLPVSGGD
jgi:alkyldihydroxyacetonephosphate synthase